MRKLITASFLLLLAMCASCTSTAPNGSRRSFSLLDIDLRSAEQIKAGLAEEQGVSAQGVPIDPGLAAAIISSVKGRIGIAVYREQPAMPAAAASYSTTHDGGGSSFQNDGNGNYKGFVTVPLEMYIAPIRLTSGPAVAAPPEKEDEYVPPMGEEFPVSAQEVPIRNAGTEEPLPPADPPPTSK